MALPRMNVEQLVEIAVGGEVAGPVVRPRSPWRVGHDGVPRVLVGTGGITYNVKVGMPARGWAGDHVEPGVSVRHPDERGAAALTALAAVGNEARVISGDAKGGVGVVTGKHGGYHLMVDFPDAVLEQLCIGDRLQFRAYGVGLAFPDHPAVRATSLDPRLAERWGLGERDGRLTVPVAKRVPAGIMGSGLGRDDVQWGDYDITLFDPEMVARHGLADLRLGDLVAIDDADAAFGWHYRAGSVTVGVICHADSHLAGHGPGVTTLLTGPVDALEPVVDAGANLADILGVGARREA